MINYLKKERIIHKRRKENGNRIYGGRRKHNQGRNEVIFRNIYRDINSIFPHILALTSFWLDHSLSR